MRKNQKTGENRLKQKTKNIANQLFTEYKDMIFTFHNPEVTGSTPVLATGKKASLKSDVFFLFTVIIYGKICNLHFIIIAKTAF